jgi:hypothetical protein
MAVLQPRPEYYPTDAARGAAVNSAAVDGDGGMVFDQQQDEEDQSPRTDRSSQKQQQQQEALQLKRSAVRKSGLPFKVY